MSSRQIIDTGPVAVVRPLRVLIVDDDGAQLRAIKRSLRDHRVQLTVVDNAIDAMLHIGTSKPDLVVMDVYMPGLDGIEACRRIKANAETRDVQVILASALMTLDLEIAAKHAGAKCALEKPITLAALVENAPTSFDDVEPVAIEQAPVQTPVMTTTRGADLLVAMLAEAGVETVFGLPGGAISPVHDALMDSPIRTITTRHENGAMFAAAGYAQTTGKLGVVAVTSGPGALNAMTGLASAHCDGLPVLLLVGEVPRSSQGKGVLQDGSAHGLQLIEMMRYVTKLAAEVPRPSALPHLVRRAIATALSGRKGPVDADAAARRDDRAGASSARRRLGDDGRHGAAREHRRSDRLDPGRDAPADPRRQRLSRRWRTGAAARGRRTAELSDRDDAESQGVFPEDHALSVGVLGMGGHPSARAYLTSGVDVVVAVGTSLGDMATDGFSPFLQATNALVHVDIDARQVGKSYSPTHAIVASAADFLGGLAERSTLARGSQPIALRQLPHGVERFALPSSTTPHRIAPQDALLEIKSCCRPTRSTPSIRASTSCSRRTTCARRCPISFS